MKSAVRKLDTQACLYTSSSSCIHTCKSKCLLIASGAPWYVSNRQIHEDVCSAVCQPHNSPDSEIWPKGSQCIAPPSKATRQKLYADRGFSPPPDEKAKGQPKPSSAMAKSTKRIAFGANHPRFFRLPWLRFSVIFLNCKTNARVYDAKSGHSEHSLSLGAAASTNCLENVAYHQFVTSNQAKYILPIISPGLPRRYSLAISFRAFSLTSKSLVYANPLSELRCLLWSPAMRSNAGMAKTRVGASNWEREFLFRQFGHVPSQSFASPAINCWSRCNKVLRFCKKHQNL